MKNDERGMAEDAASGSYSNRVQNLPCDDSAIAAELKTAFREGHKQARHAAAEMVAGLDSMMAHLIERETLRDKFAMAALPSCIHTMTRVSDELAAKIASSMGCAVDEILQPMSASLAYEIADAMLNARKP